MVDSGITGIRVVDSPATKDHPVYRIELWFDNTSKRQIIEEQFKNILSIDDPRSIYYKEHNV